MKSVKYYNGIVRLLNCLQETTDSKLLVACAVILCRIFCRLISEGKLRLHDTDTGPDIAVKGWIRLRFKDLQKELLKMISDGEHDHKVSYFNRVSMGIAH